MPSTTTTTPHVCESLHNVLGCVLVAKRLEASLDDLNAILGSQVTKEGIHAGSENAASPATPGLPAEVFGDGSHGEAGSADRVVFGVFDHAGDRSLAAGTVDRSVDLPAGERSEQHSAKGNPLSVKLRLKLSNLLFKGSVFLVALSLRLAYGAKLVPKEFDVLLEDISALDGSGQFRKAIDAIQNRKK